MKETSQDSLDIELESEIASLMEVIIGIGHVNDGGLIKVKFRSLLNHYGTSYESLVEHLNIARERELVAYSCSSERLCRGRDDEVSIKLLRNSKV